MIACCDPLESPEWVRPAGKCLFTSSCMFCKGCWWWGWWWQWSSSKDFPKRCPKGGPRWEEECGNQAVGAIQDLFWGIKWGPALQQMISVIGRYGHGFGNLILMDFALLKPRIRPPVPDLCHFEISRIWERNTESVREKYISTGRWQIQSQVVRNTIQRTNAMMLVWTEIHRQPKIAVQMQAQIYE